MSKANKAKRKKKEETFRRRGRGGLGGAEEKGVMSAERTVSISM